VPLTTLPAIVAVPIAGIVVSGVAGPGALLLIATELLPMIVTATRSGLLRVRDGGVRAARAVTMRRPNRFAHPSLPQPGTFGLSTRPNFPS
jgi:ABC-type nitrate/sulfonate/bicarbonate transport system permease component